MIPARVISVFMDNISPDVVAWQRKCVERFLPSNCEFEQYHYRGADFSHPNAIMDCLSRNTLEGAVLLDIDCIPLSDESFKELTKGIDEGVLSGAIQRANHIQNNGHLYVGPFCMAFSIEQYKELGSPSFVETSRGDCGEELTYLWSEADKPVRLFWPTDVKLPMWSLTDGTMFGLGTTYQNLFYHAFAIRQSDSIQQFISKCEEALQSAGDKPTEEAQVQPSETKELKARKIQRRKVSETKAEDTVALKSVEANSDDESKGGEAA